MGLGRGVLGRGGMLGRLFVFFSFSVFAGFGGDGLGLGGWLKGVLGGW